MATKLTPQQTQAIQQQIAQIQAGIQRVQAGIATLKPSTTTTGQVAPTASGQYTPQQVAQINALREARVAAGLDPYTGLPRTASFQTPQLPQVSTIAAQPPQIQQHQIASGENLTRIAAKYGTTVEAIMAANVGNPAIKSRDMIIAGRTIVIPQATTTLSGPLGDEQKKLDEIYDRTVEAEKERVPTRIRAIENLLTEFKMPTPPSMVDIWQRLRGQYAIGAEEQELAAVRQQIANIQSLYETAITKEEERYAPISIIRRRQERLSKDAQMELSALTRREATLVESLNQKNKVISDLMQLYQWDYQIASQNYMNEFNVKFQALQYLRGEEKEEENRAQANYSMLLNAAKDILKRGKTTFETLPLNVRLDLQEYETRLNLPRGFSDWLLRNTPIDKNIKIHAKSDDGTQVWVMYDDGSVQTFKTGFAPKVTTEKRWGEPTAAEKSKALRWLYKQPGVTEEDIKKLETDREFFYWVLDKAESEEEW